jgi:transposase
MLGQHYDQGSSRRHWRAEKNGPQAIGRSRGGCTTKIHLVAANAQCALMLKLSAGQEGDAPAGRELLEAGGPVPGSCYLIMDGAYEGDETRRLACQLGYIPVVPPNPRRREPWEYDRIVYKRRNEIERLFRRLKAYRRVFCRFDKLDALFTGFIVLALIIEALRLSVNRP